MCCCNNLKYGCMISSMSYSNTGTLHFVQNITGPKMAVIWRTGPLSPHHMGKITSPLWLDSLRSKHVISSSGHGRMIVRRVHNCLKVMLEQLHVTFKFSLSYACMVLKSLTEIKTYSRGSAVLGFYEYCGQWRVILLLQFISHSLPYPPLNMLLIYVRCSKGIGHMCRIGLHEKYCVISAHVPQATYWWFV